MVTQLLTQLPPPKDPAADFTSGLLVGSLALVWSLPRWHPFFTMHNMSRMPNWLWSLKQWHMFHTPLWRAGKWDKGVPPIENKVRLCLISLSLPSKWDKMTAMMIIVATLCHLGGGTEKTWLLWHALWTISPTAGHSCHLRRPWQCRLLLNGHASHVSGLHH